MSDIAVTGTTSTSGGNDGTSLRQLVAGVRIPTWTAAIIALAAAGYALRHTHPAGVAIAAGIMAAAAVTAAAIDYTCQRLPDALTYPIAGSGCAVFAGLQLTGGHAGLITAVAGGLAYGGGMLIIALIQPKSFLLGDVKLVAGIGVWAGGLAGWVGIYFAVLLGLLLVVLTGRIVRVRRGPDGGGFSAGPALVLGLILALTVV